MIYFLLSLFIFIWENYQKMNFSYLCFLFVKAMLFWALMFCTYNKQEVLDISKFEEDEFTTETDYSQNVNELVMKAFIKKFIIWIWRFISELLLQCSYNSFPVFSCPCFLCLFEIIYPDNIFFFIIFNSPQTLVRALRYPFFSWYWVCV